MAEPFASVIDVLLRVTRDVEGLGRSFALVGGLATSLRAEPRTTRDVDLAVAVADDAEAESLIGGLVAGGYRVLAVLEQEATGRLATVRLASPLDGVTVVDLLFGSCAIEPEIVAQATPVDLSGVRIQVARAGHLIAMKLLSRDDANRPQDLTDLVALRARTNDQEVAAARTACRLVEQRGANRGRALEQALDAWLVDERG